MKPATPRLRSRPRKLRKRRNPDEAKIVVVGHVDHGKSSLVGRLLMGSGAVSDERLEEVQRCTASGPSDRPDPAFVTDQLSVERRRGITLDTAQACLRTPRAAMVFIDTPGHRELVGNMLSGAGMADAAILVVDAQRGVEAQTFLHLAILQLLGVRTVIVAINKMDLVKYAKSRFDELAGQVAGLMNQRDLCVEALTPVSALEDQHVVSPSSNMEWCNEPPLLRCLERLRPAPPPTRGAPACFPVQTSWQAGEQVIQLGRLESGSCRVGDEMVAWPDGHAVRITAIRRSQGLMDRARAGQCLGLHVEAHSSSASNLVVGRGTVLCGHGSSLKPARRATVDVVQLLGRCPRPGQHLTVRSNLGTHRARIASADPVSTCCWHDETAAGDLKRLGLEFTEPVVLDPTGQLPSLHRLILARRGCVWGVGAVREVE